MSIYRVKISEVFLKALFTKDSILDMREVVRVEKGIPEEAKLVHVSYNEGVVIFDYLVADNKSKILGIDILHTVIDRRKE